jgi:hypothetical protein
VFKTLRIAQQKQKKDRCVNGKGKREGSEKGFGCENVTYYSYSYNRELLLSMSMFVSLQDKTKLVSTTIKKNKTLLLQMNE